MSTLPAEQPEVCVCMYVCQGGVGGWGGVNKTIYNNRYSLVANTNEATDKPFLLRIISARNTRLTAVSRPGPTYIEGGRRKGQYVHETDHSDHCS